MNFQQLTEAKSGTYVGVRLTTESTARLVGWMDQNLIKSPLPANEIHVTLVLTKDRKIGHHPMTYVPSIPIDPATFNIELFGKDQNIMVLTFQSEFLQHRHHKLRKKHGIDWDFPDYSPHITLTHEVQEIVTELEPPTFELELDREYVEAFGTDASK